MLGASDADEIIDAFRGYPDLHKVEVGMLTATGRGDYCISVDPKAGVLLSHALTTREYWLESIRGPSRKHAESDFGRFALTESHR
jgi:hypothetical protein